MEEIVSADVIQGEILDDARRKAARMLEEAGLPIGLAHLVFQARRTVLRKHKLSDPIHRFRGARRAVCFVDLELKGRADIR